MSKSMALISFSGSLKPPPLLRATVRDLLDKLVIDGGLAATARYFSSEEEGALAEAIEATPAGRMLITITVENKTAETADSTAAA